MTKLEKYKGIIPAFYACYDENGNISGERVQELAKFYLDKGVKGLYVGGSSGECIYQNVTERKEVLENVMAAVGGKMTIIAHVAAPSTRDSVELAKHAESLGVDALAAIPPIYFGLPEFAIRDYWTAMMNASSLDFIIYNIPQTTGYALSVNMLKEMMSFDQVIGVKNSSMPVQDIYLFKRNAGKEIVVFNGPDEQFVAGRIMGADAGIGGTYGVMPELFLAANQAIEDSEIEKAQEIQIMIDDIIFKMLEAKGNLYDVMKAVLVKRGITIGSVREPLPRITSEDMSIVEEVYGMLELAIKKYSL
ncbi:dihydrodipicolinate synthase family protein [Vagococcus fluvialis]|uniref:dihydrodipicolinate synthase family protein n=1 Tax=Vagococcus fluvialis TaxID=2738 RepID=UPI001A8CBF44|nr:dihydrodipicolinate synthase family protein [Vagococcus fluvialis]MBO0442916.1 dihydrodipicolinate synthase family protein [Vagococcus fluvialis]MCM2139533.1 dihydrodipicolinate synthase family protein [Vagococcus fluvialis]UDM71780.1 dihydrodipicolinate synthase family protein [Vagococcus fluvialis]UDM76645.1 dihydrodipicolinate synthase family protein [Vagococcus fluvialis]UDM83474.1 dihydrodipicolinate synthase family protein [Vagococcus fluvialis]